jgi:hypothetical protein
MVPACAGTELQSVHGTKQIRLSLWSFEMQHLNNLVTALEQNPRISIQHSTTLTDLPVDPFFPQQPDSIITMIKDQLDVKSEGLDATSDHVDTKINSHFSLQLRLQLERCYRLHGQ